MADEKNVTINLGGDAEAVDEKVKDTLEFLEGDKRQEDLAEIRERLELELREEKADTRRRMAWIALGSMLIFTVALFTPWVSEGRVTALADLLGLFYVAQATIVGAYMGVESWMTKK